MIARYNQFKCRYEYALSRRNDSDREKHLKIAKSLVDVLGNERRH